MAPALTKVLQNEHGIHLSSPPASVRVDSDEKATCTVELEPHMRSPDHSEIQKMWLNLCLDRTLDLCLPSSPPDTPMNPGLSTHVQRSASQCEMVPLPSPGSLASFLSFSKCQRDSQEEAAVFPGVSDMFLTPVSEQNSSEACLLHGWSASTGCVPGGGDGHCSFPPTSVFPSYSSAKINSWGQTPLFAPQSTMHEKVAAMACPTPPPAAVQPGIGMVTPDKLELTSVSEEAVKELLSRQSRLEGRALGLRGRLHTLLGEHALLHCSQQLDGLNKSCHAGEVSPDSMDPVDYGFGPVQACSTPRYSWQELSTASLSVTELREFSHSSQAVLRGLQEALDSEATGSSSSSDEESEEDNIQRKTSPDCCQWLEERAELGSRWSWLQLRLAELEGRIQHMTELHKHIRSTKRRVELLTNREIQIFPLKREKTGSSYTAWDADTEPCSPARLLRNIERQSAQLSQIVNSLMTPLGFSPLSKQPRTLKGKANTSGQREDDVCVSGISKRRRLRARRLFKADASCVCARTRPLLTYHKRKLFTFNSDKPSALNSRNSMSTLSSFLSSSSCSCGSACNPVAQVSDPNCSSRGALSSSSSKPSSVAPVLFDSPTWPKSQKSVAREEWSQRPLIINARPFSQADYNRNSSTPRHNNHKCKKNALKKALRGLSPIRSSCPGRSGHSRSNQRKRKRRRIHKGTDDEVVAYQLYNLGESSDKVLEESCTQAADKQASRGDVRKRQGESVYNIKNIVIPASLSKVEKLQYKDILTPGWRVVDVDSLTDMEAEEEEQQQVEDVSDDVFAQRHLALEQKEKLCWSSRERQNCCKHTTRSASRLSGSGTGICTSGEESAEWSCGQLDADEQLQSEEWLTQAPWEPRVFPLETLASLLSDEVGELPSGWGDCTSTSNTSKNSSSNASSAQSACATLPSHGQKEDS